MPVHYKSKGLFSLDHIYKWLKSHFHYDRLPPEPRRKIEVSARIYEKPDMEPPTPSGSDCLKYHDLNLISDLCKHENIIIVNLPGANQDLVNRMIQTMKNVLKPKPDSIILVLGHKEVHLIVQGKGRSKSVILQLVKNHGFKIKRYDDEYETRN